MQSWEGSWVPLYPCDVCCGEGVTLHRRSGVTLYRMQHDNGSSPQPVKKETKIVVDDFDRDVIRRTIQAMLFSRQQVPNVTLLKEELQKWFGFSGGKLRKLLHETGFRWKKDQNQQKPAHGTNRHCCSKSAVLTEDAQDESRREDHSVHRWDVCSYVSLCTPVLAIRVGCAESPFWQRRKVYCSACWDRQGLHRRGVVSL